MTGEELRRALAGYIDKMPPLPTSAAKVLEICQSPKAQPSDLNRVIALDPVLLARVMKLINSAYYGLNQEVTSLVRAIIMLGINTVKNLALSTAVLGSLHQSASKQAVLNLDGFWLHSLCVGAMAKQIAKKRGVPATELETYFFCGLLHDIGKLPLNYRAPEDYLRALHASADQRIDLILAERSVLGLDHVDSGLLILNTWNLSDDLKDVLEHHHRPLDYSGPYSELLYTVVVADYFANVMEIGFSGNRFPSAPPAEIYRRLETSWAELELLESEVRQDIDRAKIFLNLS